MSIRDLPRRLRLKFVSAPDFFVGMSMCLIVGLVCGASAALLRWLIQHMSLVAHSMMHLEKGNWMLIVLPVVGIVCTGIFTRYILRDDIEHASDKINDRLHRGITDISPKLIYGPLVASTMTLGFGGSAGAEGPIATIGAALGGNLSRPRASRASSRRRWAGCSTRSSTWGLRSLLFPSSASLPHAWWRR